MEDEYAKKMSFDRTLFDIFLALFQKISTTFDDSPEKEQQNELDISGKKLESQLNELNFVWDENHTEILSAELNLGYKKEIYQQIVTGDGEKQYLLKEIKENEESSKIVSSHQANSWILAATEIRIDDHLFKSKSLTIRSDGENVNNLPEFYKQLEHSFFGNEFSIAAIGHSYGEKLVEYGKDGSISDEERILMEKILNNEFKKELADLNIKSTNDGVSVKWKNGQGEENTSFIYDMQAVNTFAPFEVQGVGVELDSEYRPSETPKT